MALRIPLTADQTLQTEFHEIERRLRKLEKATGTTAGSSIRIVSGSGGTGTVDLGPIYARITALENELNNLPAPVTNNFGGVGPSSISGLVPAPGTAVPPTGVAGHVLLSDGTWGFPFRGLVQVATSGEQTDPPLDVVNVLGGLTVLGSIQASEVVAGVVHPPGWMACCDDDLLFGGLI